MIDGIWNAFSDLLRTVLPLSPFTEFYATWEQPAFLGWLNWLFPVALCVRTLAAWAGAVGLYYLYSIVMRWVKVIG